MIFAEMMEMDVPDRRWDSLLDEAGIVDPEQRALVAGALTMTHQGILTHFAGRIESFVVEYESYSASERRMPLNVQAPHLSDEECGRLEQELAEKVLGPVFRETRITLPPFILGGQEIDEPGVVQSGVGILYRAA